MDCASAPTDYAAPKVGKLSGLSDPGGGGGGGGGGSGTAAGASNGVDACPPAPSSPAISSSPRPGKPVTPNNNNADAAHQPGAAPAAGSPVAGVSLHASTTSTVPTLNNPSPGPTNKILSRNCNGTVVTTSAPSNEAELQLYRVMQRASLLAYYDTLLEMGGDDVQQLCEAGEQEFLEIMSLVGMASKPLHVRRLQKALQEWFSNPVQFQVPLAPTPASFPMTQRGVPVVRGISPSPSPVHPSVMMGLPPPPHPMVSAAAAGGVVPTPVESSRASTVPVASASTSVLMPPSHANVVPAPAAPSTTSFGQLASPTSPGIECQTPDLVATNHSSPVSLAPPPSSHLLRQGASSPSPSTIHAQAMLGIVPQTTSSAPSSPPARSTSPALQLTPVLLESQIARLAEAAESLARSLPAYQPRPHNAKKKICKDLEVGFLSKTDYVATTRQRILHVINMSESDPRRMEEIRKYAAIYGRFDCKRKPEKPLTLHEVSVNEAAAQICRFVPALLTRRDELFPLARQVVRDSGYLYSKGHASLTCYRSTRSHNGDDILTAGHKRPRIDSSAPPELLAEQIRRQERFDQIQDELRQLAERADELAASRDSHALHAVQVRQGALHAEHAELLRHALAPSARQRRTSGRTSSLLDSERPDTDDTDSQLSLSNASSPSQESVGEGIRLVQELQRSDNFYGEAKVQVIASSGGNIIAVANPALSMSPALLQSPVSPPPPSRSPASATSIASPASPASGDSPPSVESPDNVLDHRLQPKVEPQSPPSSPPKVVCRRGRADAACLKNRKLPTVT